MSITVLYCPYCWAENPPSESCCRQCGKDLTQPEEGDYIDRLIRFSLHHPEPTVAPRAAYILGRLGDRRVVEPLIQVLQTATDPALLEAACEALGRLQDPRALSVLAEKARNSWLIVRAKAVWALGQIGGEEAKQVLQEVAQKDPTPSIRRDAQRILTSIKVLSEEKP